MRHNQTRFADGAYDYHPSRVTKEEQVSMLVDDIYAKLGIVMQIADELENLALRSSTIS